MVIRIGPRLEKPYGPAELTQAAQGHKTQMQLYPKNVDYDDPNLNCKSMKLYR